MNNSPPIIGFAASSGTGKTTLLSQVIPALNKLGVHVGIIKHSHHDFDVDQPGKDSYRLRKAGASPVVLVSKFRRMLITELDGQQEPTLSEQLNSFANSNVDLIIVEGFRHENFPKIELHRKEIDKPFLFSNDPSIIAIASNDTLTVDLPVLDINAPDEVAEFINNHFLNTQSHG